VSRIFLAGAAGVIGRRLAPLLRQAGHSVWGTTRSPDRTELVRSLGARPVVVDVFDAEALAKAVLDAKPEIVIHQLTDLASIHDPAKRAQALARNARLRDEGTRNLVAAAHRAGARRLIAQSIAWVYAPIVKPYRENYPLDAKADGSRGVTVRGVASLERQILSASPIEGLVLRLAGYTAPAAERTRRGRRRRRMSTRRLTPPCWRSITASRASSTSPTRATRSRPKRRQPNLAGAPSSGSRRSEPAPPHRPTLGWLNRQLRRRRVSPFALAPFYSPRNQVPQSQRASSPKSRVQGPRPQSPSRTRNPRLPQRQDCTRTSDRCWAPSWSPD
jgi:NAD(P)-dependent dehydrogenase (short-subunit alcohol dehydrogenase family)